MRKQAQMSTSHTTRICSSCGQRKSLSAFLQLDEKNGTTYGTLCSTCRKTQANETEKESDDSITERLTLKIDTKARVYEAISSRKLQELIKDRTEKERLKIENLKKS